MSGRGEGFYIVDGPLKGQMRASERDYFDAYRMTPERLHRCPDPAAPVHCDVVRYTLTRVGGGHVWSCGFA